MTKSKANFERSASKSAQPRFVLSYNNMVFLLLPSVVKTQLRGTHFSITTNNNFWPVTFSRLKHLLYKPFMCYFSSNMPHVVSILQAVQASQTKHGSPNKLDKWRGYLRIIRYLCVFSSTITIPNSPDLLIAFLKQAASKLSISPIRLLKPIP